MDALGGVLNLDVGGVSVPITLDGTNVGAASNYASTPLPSEATAASGTITGDGAIDVDGASGDFATVDLTAALQQLGVDTTGVIDAVELQLGAVASSASEEAGVISSDYMLAGADLVIDSRRSARSPMTSQPWSRAWMRLWTRRCRTIFSVKSPRRRSTFWASSESRFLAIHR